MERASRVVWAKRVERWKDSGLTAKEFAAEIDVSPNSLSYWKWKLRGEGDAGSGERVRRRRQRAAAPTTSSFLQLVPTPDRSAVGVGVELVLRGGLMIRVQPGFDEQTLTRLVALLGGR